MGWSMVEEGPEALAIATGSETRLSVMISKSTPRRMGSKIKMGPQPPAESWRKEWLKPGPGSKSHQGNTRLLSLSVMHPSWKQDQLSAR